MLVLQASIVIQADFVLQGTACNTIGASRKVLPKLLFPHHWLHCPKRGQFCKFLIKFHPMEHGRVVCEIFIFRPKSAQASSAFCEFMGKYLTFSEAGIQAM